MRYCNNQIVYKLILLSSLPFLLAGCVNHLVDKTNEIKKRKLISFHSYIDSSDSKNSIFLEIPDSGKNELKNINVKLTHGAGCTAMSNLIVTIYTDTNQLRIIEDDFRFLETEFNSIGDTTAVKVFNLVTSKFHSFNNNATIGYTDLIKEINTSRRIAISATMNDFALLKDPLSSSSLRHSNLIEWLYK